MTTAAKTKPYKAIGAFVVAFLGGLALTTVDNGISLGDFIGALSLGATNAGAVYAIRNTPSDGE